jgi:release factor glutamine methyltransferase
VIAREALNLARRRLAEAGIDEAPFEAEVIVREAMRLPRERLFTSMEAALLPEAETRFHAVLSRRCEREPLAYITGRREFFGLDLAITPDVLVPRPETEHVVEEVLRLVAAIRAPLVIDVGTGSGAIALAVSHSRPDATVVATDLSRGALALARRNAVLLGLEKRITFAHGDLLSTVRARAHVVAANLPYIPTREIAGLEPEIRDFEPLGALDGGDDGLTLIRRLVAEAPSRLAQDGALVLEVAAGQAATVMDLQVGSPFAAVSVRKDLAGIERVVTFRLP